jgi:hypothetical protein
MPDLTLLPPPRFGMCPRCGVRPGGFDWTIWCSDCLDEWIAEEAEAFAKWEQEQKDNREARNE